MRTCPSTRPRDDAQRFTTSNSPTCEERLLTAQIPLPSEPQLRAWLDESAFHKLLRLELDSVDQASQTVSLRCRLSPALERAPGTGQYHGGVIASLIDIAGDFALIAVLGHGVPTIDLRVDYLRPAFGADLVARARVRKAGRTIAVVDVDVTHGDDRVLAVGRGCYGTSAG